jgi:hypothetical protein
MAGLQGIGDRNTPGTICHYCNRSESTILIWIRTLDFPAVKIPGGWEADTDLIDEWRKNTIIERNNKKKKAVKP